MSNSFSSPPGSIPLEDAIHHIVRESRQKYGARLRHHGLPVLLIPGIAAHVRQIPVPTYGILYFQILQTAMALHLEFSRNPAAKTSDAVALYDWLVKLAEIVRTLEWGTP